MSHADHIEQAEGGTLGLAYQPMSLAIGRSAVGLTPSIRVAVPEGNHALRPAVAPYGYGRGHGRRSTFHYPY